MKQLFTKFIKKRCELIVEEENVTDILRIIRHRTSETVRVGDCGWVGHPTKWYIMFHATEDTWIEIKKALRNEDFKEIKETLKDCFGNETFQII